MMYEFSEMKGVEKEVLNARHLSCEHRLFKYAPLEKKKTVKAILQDMRVSGPDSEGIFNLVHYYMYHCVR